MSPKRKRFFCGTLGGQGSANPKHFLISAQGRFSKLLHVQWFGDLGLHMPIATIAVPLPIFQTFPEKEVSAMDVKPHGWIFLVLGVMSWFEYTVGGTSRHFEWSYLHDISTAQWSSSRAVAFTIEASIAAIAKHALLLCLLAFGCTLFDPPFVLAVFFCQWFPLPTVQTVGMIHSPKCLPPLCQVAVKTKPASDIFGSPPQLHQIGSYLGFGFRLESRPRMVLLHRLTAAFLHPPTYHTHLTIQSWPCFAHTKRSNPWTLILDLQSTPSPRPASWAVFWPWRRSPNTQVDMSPTWSGLLSGHWFLNMLNKYSIYYKYIIYILLYKDNLTHRFK